MSHAADGKKSKLMTYGMYAGAGLLVGVVAYFGYKMFSNKTSTAAPGAAKANASGHRNVAAKIVHGGGSAWCRDKANFSNPEYNRICGGIGDTGHRNVAAKIVHGGGSAWCRDKANFENPDYNRICGGLGDTGHRHVSGGTTWIA